MAKIFVLQSDVKTMKDKQTAEEVKMTKIQVLKKVGDEFVVKMYYLAPANQKGFRPEMVSDPYTAKAMHPVDGDFDEGVDFTTKREKIVLTALRDSK